MYEEVWWARLRDCGRLGVSTALRQRVSVRATHCFEPHWPSAEQAVPELRAERLGPPPAASCTWEPRTWGKRRGIVNGWADGGADVVDSVQVCIQVLCDGVEGPSAG